MKYFTTAHWLVVVLIAIIVGLLFGGGLIYFWPGSGLRQESNSQPITATKNNDANQVIVNTLNTAPSTNSTNSAAANESSSAKVPGDWLTYTEPQSEITFSYPSEWGSASSAAAEKFNLTWSQVPVSNVVFDNLKGSFSRQVSISKIKDYQALKSDSGFVTHDFRALMNVYQNSNADNLESSIWLPPSNAGVLYRSKPQYVESASGDYRGVYYFAFIGQANPFKGAKQAVLTSMVMVMTDGDQNVIQFEYRDPKLQHSISDFSKIKSVATKECFSSMPGLPNCVVDEKVLNQFKDIYSIVVDSLK